MTTVDDVIAIQKTDNVLYTPTVPSTATIASKVISSGGVLTIQLQNQTTSNNVYAYITGIAINNNNSVFLLQSDGQTAYYPSNPASNGTSLSANCAISLGAPGATRTVIIPHIAGGRIWFCVNNKLTFLLNSGQSGPGLVEPSVTNPSDPNYNLCWDFCEFTFNSAELYANISYVDFVCLPIALTSISGNGATQHVGGLPSNGLYTICANLDAQNAIDNAGWNQLVVQQNGTNLRALSPTNGILFNPNLFKNYWTPYLQSIWSKYISTNIVIDTQSSWGTVTGCTSNDRTSLVFGTSGSFTQPSAADIFSASTGAFAAQANNTAQLLNIGARLDAALNRSTLLANPNQPDDEVVSQYYQNPITNHYARIVHAANVDGLGYTFPYDDVTPSNALDQSGKVEDGNPVALVVAVGGANAYAAAATTRRREEEYIPTGRAKLFKRGLELEEDTDVKQPVVVDEDLETGMDEKLRNEYALPGRRPGVALPPVVDRLFGRHITTILNHPLSISIATRLQPLLLLITQFLNTILSISMRAVVSRVFIVAFFLLFYFFGLVPHGSEAEVGAAGDNQRRVLEALVGGGAVMRNGTVV